VITDNMPKINIKNGQGVIVWDENDWMAGLTSNYGNNIFSINSLTNGLSWATDIDPNRLPGFLMPGASPVDMTNVAAIDAVQIGGINNSTTGYTIGGTKVHSINLTTNTITNSGGVFPHTITAHGGHTTVLGQDVVVYNVGATKYLFYSWSDNTDGDVGRYDLTSTFDDDYMSTVAASGAVLTAGVTNHPMIIGSDDVLYIGNGNILSGFDGQDGANGTFLPAQLTLPEGYVITSFAKTPNYLVIFAYKDTTGGSFYKGESRAFYYDYFSVDPTFTYDLQGNYVNGAFNFDDNQIGCFVRGSNSYTNYNRQSKLKLFDGTKFRTIFNFNEGIPVHGGVEVSDDVITWNASGVIYQYGTPHIGFDKTFNRVASAGATSGILRNFSGNTLVASAGVTTTGGMELINANYSSSAVARTPQVNLKFRPGYKAQFDKLVVYYGFKATDGNKARISLLSDGNTTSEVVDNSDETTANEFIEEYYNLTNNKSLNFLRVGWQLSYEAGVLASTPDVVSSIELYFKEIKK
jgi:hypothetical protein